jgi:hypothetical protein
VLIGDLKDHEISVESISTTAGSCDRRREKECFPDRGHFGLKALLRGLIPESRKVRGCDRPGDYFNAGVSCVTPLKN